MVKKLLLSVRVEKKITKKLLLFRRVERKIARKLLLFGYVGRKITRKLMLFYFVGKKIDKKLLLLRRVEGKNIKKLLLFRHVERKIDKKLLLLGHFLEINLTGFRNLSGLNGFRLPRDWRYLIAGTRIHTNKERFTLTTKPELSGKTTVCPKICFAHATSTLSPSSVWRKKHLGLVLFLFYI